MMIKLDLTYPMNRESAALWEALGAWRRVLAKRGVSFFDAYDRHVAVMEGHE